MLESTTKKPVHLRFDGGKVWITPEDSARFKMAARRAVRVLHREKAIDREVMRFQDEYLPRLNRWCEENKDLVRACYLGRSMPHGLTVFILGMAPKYSFGLGDKISDLAIQLEDEGWSSNIVQISNGEDDEIATFFDPESALQIYAQSQAAPGQG
jgi:hypothetical protein